MLRNRRSNYPVDILPLHSYEEKPKFFRGNHRYWILLMVLIVLLGSGGIIYIAVSRKTVPPHMGQSDTRKSASHKDDRPATHMDQSDIHEAAHSMESRIMHMQEACLQYLGMDQQSARFKVENMLYNRSNKILYCPSLKTGSTNFIVHLLTLAGIKEKILRKKTASSLYKKAHSLSAHISFLENIGLGRDNSMTKVITVRHPFERLLSAYRTVFERKSAIFSAHQHTAFTIIKNYHNPKFPPSKDRVHPTFDEFVRYLIYKAEVENNPYWTPYFHYCSPCDVNYNYIIKMETSTRDQQFLLNQIHLDGILKPQEMNVNPEGRTSLDVMEQYLSKVTSGDLKLLHAKYDADFKLFNYDSYPYMKFATKGEAVLPANDDTYSEEHGMDEEDDEEREKKKYDEYRKKENKNRHGSKEDNDLQGMHDDIHDDTAQDVRNENNFFQTLPDNNNIFQDKEEHNGFQNTGTEKDNVQDKASKDTMVQNTAGEHNMIQDKVGEQMEVKKTAEEDLVHDATGGSNTAQDTTDEHNGAQNTASLHNVVEDVHNVVEDATGQANVVQNTVDEHSTVQDKDGKHNMVQETATEQKADQNTAGEHVVQDATSGSNKVQDTVSKDNVAYNTANEQNAAQNTAEHVVQDTTSGSNKAQDTVSTDNVAHDTADEQNAAQNTAGVHNVVQDATVQANVVQDTKGEHSMIQDIEGGHNVVQDSSEHDISQNNGEQHKVPNPDDHNEERKFADGQSVGQGNTEHQTVQETLSEKMVKEESNEHSIDNTDTADNVVKYT